MRIGGIQCCVRFETDRGGSVGRGKRHPRHGFHSGPFGATTSVEKLFLQCRATRFPEICPRLWGSGLSICYTVFIIQIPRRLSPSRCGDSASLRWICDFSPFFFLSLSPFLSFFPPFFFFFFWKLVAFINNLRVEWKAQANR